MLSQIHCHESGPVSKTIDLSISLGQALRQQGAWVTTPGALLRLSVLQGCRFSQTQPALYGYGDTAAI